MNFNERLLVARRDELNGKGVRVRFIGRRTGRVPRRVLRRIEETEALTARNRRLTLTFAFNYGGRAELVDAVRDDRARGRRRPARSRARSTSATLHRHLYAPDMPDPDLLVRTSGEHRISNYLLWQLAYSELRLHRRAVARLPPRAPLRRDRGVPAPRAPLRRRLSLAYQQLRRSGLSMPHGVRRPGSDRGGITLV